MTTEQLKEMAKVAQSVARNTQAVLKALSARPNVFSAEEYSSVGALFDQSLRLNQMAEDFESYLEESESEKQS